MSFPINTTALKFMVSSEPRPQADLDGVQKKTYDGIPKWVVELLMSREGHKSQVIEIKVPLAEKPKLSEGQKVTVDDLELLYWDNGKSSGNSLSAASITPVASGKASA